MKKPNTHVIKDGNYKKDRIFQKVISKIINQYRTRKTKDDQHRLHQNPGVNTGDPKRCAIPAPHVVSTMLHSKKVNIRLIPSTVFQLHVYRGVQLY